MSQYNNSIDMSNISTAFLLHEIIFFLKKEKVLDFQPVLDRNRFRLTEQQNFFFVKNAWNFISFFRVIFSIGNILPRICIFTTFLMMVFCNTVQIFSIFRVVKHFDGHDEIELVFFPKKKRKLSTVTFIWHPEIPTAPYELKKRNSRFVSLLVMECGIIINWNEIKKCDETS